MRKLLLLLAMSAGSASAQTNSIVFNAAPVPTLDDIGLIALALAVAVAGGVAVRRRHRK